MAKLAPYVVASRNAAVSGVVSVNGIQGEVTNENAGIASSGVNSDITSLTGLTGPLTLGADGTTDMQAVTVRQMNAAVANASGGGDGGTIVGASGFVGSVQWYNGSSTTIPSGFVAANGQTLSRTAYAELWDKISSNGLTNVTDSAWLASQSVRACYSTGDGSTTFRMPDLNGQFAGNGSTQPASLAPVFLGGLDSDGQVMGVGVGGVTNQAAPNITASFESRPLMQGGSQADAKAFSLHLTHSGAVINTWTSDAGLGNIEGPTLNTAVSTVNADGWNFDASRSDATYGRDSGSLSPITARGIWIVQTTMSLTENGDLTVNGGVSAKRTTSPTPASGVSVAGGALGSYAYVDSGSAAHFSFTAGKTMGTNGGYASLYVKDDIDGGANTWTFPYKGRNVSVMAVGDYGIGNVNSGTQYNGTFAAYCAEVDPINWGTTTLSTEETAGSFFNSPANAAGTFNHWVMARGGRPCVLTMDYTGKRAYFSTYSSASDTPPFNTFQISSTADTAELELQLVNLQSELAAEKAARLALERDVTMLLDMHKDIVAEA